MDLTCKKCPFIKGDTYCSFNKKTIWKEDEMCEQGYRARMKKGIDKCAEIYDKNDTVIMGRVNKMWEQVEELGREWSKRFYKSKTKEEWTREFNKTPF